ncbi:TonB-dependent receptor domain-containing protein [Yoonia sp.]|uniref:TonB-dependent receptor domain-containing protein n=1 Tax=Yoonia sp. TaxID=2212373 RepID=UPI003F4ACA7E
MFQIDRNNVVTGAFPSFDQLETVRSRGVEVEGEYDFANGFRLQGAATFLDGDVTSDSDASLIGTTPILFPDAQISLLGTYAFYGDLDGLEIGLGVRRVGNSYADAANTLDVPSTTLADLFVTYEAQNGIITSLGVTNVADKRHVTGCQTLYVCSYGAGREASHL